jgi:type I restriction enzyme, S subunit
MSKTKQKSMEELLEEALVPEEEQPYKVPENWVWVRLKSINKGKKRNIDPRDYREEVFELYSVPNYDFDEPEYIKGKEIGSNKQIVKENEILLCKINPRINRVWMVSNNRGKYRQLASTEWIVISENKEIYPKYLLFLLKAPYFRKLITSNVSGVGGSLTRARPKEVETYPIALPPFNEQKRIAEKIERLFAKINEAKLLIEEVKESFELRRAAILDKAIKGKLVEQDTREESATNLLAKVEIEREKLIKEKKLKKKNIEPIKPEEIPYDIPRNWAWVRLEQITDLSYNAIRRGPFGSAITKEMFVPKGENTYKVYEQKNAIQQNAFLGDYYISEEKYNSLISFRVLPGDIIVSCAGTIGKTFIIPDDAPAGIINQALLKIRLNNSVIDNEYFLYLFEALLLKHIHQTAKGSAIKNMVSVDYLKKTLLIPLPPIMEQKRIVEKLNFILDNLKKEQEYIESLESELEILKQSILNKAFRGELGTNDPTDEHAIELLKEVLKSK